MNGLNSKDNLERMIVMALPDAENKKAEEFMAADVSDVVIPSRLEHRIRRRIDHFSGHRNEGKAKVVLRRTLVALFAAVLLLIALCASVGAIRSRIINAVFTEHDGYDQYDYEANKALGEETAEGFKRPAWVPLGLEGEVESESRNHCFIVYDCDGDGDIILAEYKRTAKVSDFVSNEGCTVSDVTINGFDGLMYTFSDGSIHIVWAERDYLYTLTNSINSVTMEDLIKMAESLK